MAQKIVIMGRADSDSNREPSVMTGVPDMVSGQVLITFPGGAQVEADPEAWATLVEDARQAGISVVDA